MHFIKQSRLPDRDSEGGSVFSRWMGGRLEKRPSFCLPWRVNAAKRNEAAVCLLTSCEETVLHFPLRTNFLFPLSMLLFLLPTNFLLYFTYPTPNSKLP